MHFRTFTIGIGILTPEFIFPFKNLEIFSSYNYLLSFLRKPTLSSQMIYNF